MTEENLRETWLQLFTSPNDYYIYGAAVAAKKCIKIADSTNVIHKIKGCVVTNAKDNPSSLEGFPVFDIHDIQDKNINILVTHVGFYRDEICSLLHELGFQQIYLVGKYINPLSAPTPQVIDDDTMQEVRTLKEQLSKNQDSETKQHYTKIIDHITSISQNNQPDFGGSYFYQSLERIGLEGVRPTLYRIKKYGLSNLLSKEQRVLDIGCNTGFLDIELAPYVKEVTGIEYDSSLVQVGNYVKNQLNLNNVSFINEDFCKWSSENTMQFDLILSFAIHHWLNFSAKEYANILYNLINDNGYICIESHNLLNGDPKYQPCIDILVEKGLSIKMTGDIMDDGVSPRKFVIMQK